MNHDDVVISIRAMLDTAEPPASGDCCIYKVPFDIRRLKEDAYTPNVVSIGPFHHGSHPRLQNMQRHKLVFCNAFFGRDLTTLDTFISYIEGEEAKFRSCYSDPIELSKEELVQVILVDSCFILELFWKYYYREDDKYLSKPWLATKIRLDLLLLENQLPFFVLDNLYNLSFNSASATPRNIPSFLELTFDYFEYYNRSDLAFDNKITICHFTDLIRTFHLQHHPETRSHRKVEQVKHLRSASELVEAGVRFEVNTKSKCLLDLRFSGHVLKIPQLKVEDWTEILFRNMVALEQCHYPEDSYITDYVAIWDFLINTNRDVDVMVRKGILVNWLGDSDSVANLFNGLWKNIIHANFSSDYLSLCKGLNDYCRNPRHKLKATLSRDYCNTPWRTVASLAGIALLLLSLLQSVCAVIQVVQQYKSS